MSGSSKKGGGGGARVVATPGYGPTDKQVEIEYTDSSVIGSGSFGVVYSAMMVSPNCKVAIKKVLQDKRFKNRELQIMRQIQHPNVVKLHYFFYSSGDKKDDLFLNLILEFMPETVYRVIKFYSKQSTRSVPLIYIKVYMYQVFRALAYVHSKGVCHRDIKPQNLLVDSATGILKLCDFGSAKYLNRDEQNVSYICSRYYRAPELIFNATVYTTSIDMWSAGCVLAEMFLGRPLFPGESSVDQLVEIIKVLGTPTQGQIEAMNPGYSEYRFPFIKPIAMSSVFRGGTSEEGIKLSCELLRYNSSERLKGLEACVHSFFDSLRQPNVVLPNGSPLPPLFNFTYHELGIQPSVNPKLLAGITSGASGESGTTTASSSPAN